MANTEDCFIMVARSSDWVAGEEVVEIYFTLTQDQEVMLQRHAEVNMKFGDIYFFAKIEEI